jgi:predicted RNase H-like HicB family nuclease
MTEATITCPPELLPSPDGYELSEVLFVGADKYHRRILVERGYGFTGLIDEFPGCIAIGETLDEVLTNLEEVREAWLESATEKGQTIPPPRSDDEERLAQQVT